jgi:hypothetical protein
VRGLHWAPAGFLDHVDLFVVWGEAGSRAQRELLAERKRTNIVALSRLDEGGVHTNRL